MGLTSVMNILMAACLVTLAFSLMMLLRVQLVFRIRIRYHDWWYQRAIEAIDAGRYDDGEAGANCNGLSYDRMMWSLHKWTYRQFFPAAA